MATRPGEELAVTLYADVHYYYAAPTSKPMHHRFDKRSYVYLFENVAQRRARIEVANNAGTPEQDAFTGYLDAVAVSYSYEHTNVVTLVVDAHVSGRPISSNTDWHLPGYDARNEQKYMYKVHTLDIYFWKRPDALKFLTAVRRNLPEQQALIRGEPAPVSPSHMEAPNPVVQRLENIAVAEPIQQASRKASTVSQSSQLPLRQADGRALSLPGPPPLVAAPIAQEQPRFTPMAYNPAAPAAPEVIQHREKTPPPDDGNTNPLAIAATSDHGQPYSARFNGNSAFSSPTHQSAFSPLVSTLPHQTAMHSNPSSPPPHQHHIPHGLPSPPAQSQQSYFPSNLPSPPAQPQPNYFPGTLPSTKPVHNPYNQHLASVPSFAAPPTSATLPPPPPPQNGAPPTPSPPSSVSAVSNTGLSMTSPTPIAAQPAHATPASPPPNSFQFPPTQQVAQQTPIAPGDTSYGIHNIAYQPGQDELAAKQTKSRKKDDRRMQDIEKRKEEGKDGPGARGRLEDHAAKAEGKVGGFLKRMEKKYL